MALVTTLGLVVYLFMRNVDDVDMSAKRIRNSLRFDEERMVMVDDDPTSMDMMTDEDMMCMFKKIANPITRMIRWEDDFTQKHPDNKLPVLDVKMFIDLKDQTEPIKYEFYQ